MTPTETQINDFKSWLKKYGRSDSTIDQYAANIIRVFESGGPFERLTDTELSPKYLHLTKAAVKGWAEFAGDLELLKEVSKIRLPPALRQGRDNPLSVSDWRELKEEVDAADYLKEPVRAELGMLVCRGFRCGDVLRLKRSEVVAGLKKGSLEYEGKGRKRIVFTVAPIWKGYLEILESFADWDRVEDLICPRSRSGKTRTASAGRLIARSLDRCCRRVGIDEDGVHPHLLRHTYATRYYEACKDPAKLQAHMGWSNINTAMGYVSAGSVEQLDSIADSLFE